MKYLKGFIFTLDAVFALIVASVGVSILLYMHFTSPSFSQPLTIEAASFLHNLLQTSMGKATGTQYALFATRSGSASFDWPYFGGSSSLSSSKAYGPQALDLLYNFTASNTITPIIAVGEGVATFGAGSELYAIDAMKGTLIPGFPISTGTAFLGSPVIYNHKIIYANSSGYLTAVSIKNGKRIWSSDIGVSVSTPLAIEDGYIVFSSGYDFYIAYPSNGSIVSYAKLPQASQLPVYKNGAFIVTTSTSGAQNYLLSYALNGNTLTQNWEVPLSTSPASIPSIYNNLIFVGNGSRLSVFTMGGSQKYNVVLDSQVYGGVAEDNGNAYVETTDKLYSFNISTDSAIYASTQVDNENVTPSVTPYDVYIMPSGKYFDAYDIVSGKQIWNFTFPSSASSKYASISLAYGNVYVAAGSNLYAFGTCRAQANQSIASALAGFYLNKEGGCASEILNNLYKSQNVGMFINGSYAPSIQTAYFNGTAKIITKTQLETQNFTIVMWVNPANAVKMESGDGYSLISTSGSTNEINLWLNNGGDASVAPGSGVQELGIGTNYYHGYGIDNNTWSFLAFTVNNGTISFYANGKGPYIVSGVSAPAYSLNNISLAGSAAGISQYAGYMSNVQIYSKSLSNTQVSELYRKGISGVPLEDNVGLYTWWPLNGNANDYSGNNHVGIPNKVYYINAHTSALAGAYQVSKGTIPLSISVNGINKAYNVSAVVWR